MMKMAIPFFTSLLVAVLSTQSCAGVPFIEGDEWNLEYSSAHVPARSRAFIYAAYRDTREGMLVIFGEVYEDVAETITHCQFHSDNQSTLTVAATVENLPHQHWVHRKLERGVRALEEFVPIRVECDLRNTQFKHAAATLMAGDEPLHGIADVFDIPVERVGRLAACVGPLVSGALPQEWVRHHLGLGVEQIFSFVPSGTEYMDGKHNVNGDIPRNILDYLHWSGTFLPKPVTLTPLESVEYMLYAPPASAYYFGQFAMMHACWFRQRHAYDFVMDLDTDEYIWLEAGMMSQPKPAHALLDSVPGDAAAVTLGRFVYPPKCQPTNKSVPLVRRAIMRQPLADWQGKFILRPRDVVIATNHKTLKVREGMQMSVDLSRSAKIKHLRDEGLRYEGSFDCDSLVKDESNWQVGQGSVVPIRR